MVAGPGSLLHETHGVRVPPARRPSRELAAAVPLALAAIWSTNNIGAFAVPWLIEAAFGRGTP